MCRAQRWHCVVQYCWILWPPVDNPRRSQPPLCVRDLSQDMYQTTHYPIKLYIHNKCTKMHTCAQWILEHKNKKYKDACSTTCDPCCSMLSTRKHLRSPVVGENIVWRYFTIKLRSICGDVLRYLTKRLQKFNEIVSNINASFQTSWSERRKSRQER